MAKIKKKFQFNPSPKQIEQALKANVELNDTYRLGEQLMNFNATKSVMKRIKEKSSDDIKDFLSNDTITKIMVGSFIKTLAETMQEIHSKKKKK